MKEENIINRQGHHQQRSISDRKIRNNVKQTIQLSTEKSEKKIVWKFPQKNGDNKPKRGEKIRHLLKNTSKIHCDHWMIMSSQE